MNDYIKHIGLLDNDNKCHNIDLYEGLNIITGRSSTGKSAIIEIFDYCFGNSENTIPHGVITDCAKIYFVVLQIKGKTLVLARTQEVRSSYCFFKIDSAFPDINDLQIEYFESDYFFPLKVFKEQLGQFLGINISSTDEDEYLSNLKGKNGRPSIRNMISYMLQHQNLIANKHSLFYRFDEKEKREKTIDEFKIFTGFVDQNYFILKQELNIKKLEYDKKQREAVIFNDIKKSKVRDLELLLDEFKLIAGNPLFLNQNASDMLDNPKLYLQKLDENPLFKIDENSDIFRIKYLEIEKQKNELLSSRRDIVLKLENIKSSIRYAENYINSIDEITPISEAKRGDSVCPFCFHKNENINIQVNKLSNAIKWLNNELEKAPLMIDSFLPEKLNKEIELKEIDKNLRNIYIELDKISRINTALSRNRSLQEQSLKIRLSIENILEWSLDQAKRIFELDLESLNKEIFSLKEMLESKYNVDKKIKDAEIFINKTMNEIGSKLDFEKSYQSMNLHFDISTFELYYIKNGTTKKKIFLRSMGSGANWLYSHVCLFLSLHKYFCSLGDSCFLPSILFLDQPTQVYFPTIIDIDKEKFNPDKLKKIQGEIEKQDADLNSVVNLFNQVINFINEVDSDFGKKPQIIISDHVDNLDLKNYSFDNYVRARWRKEDEGFIKNTRME